MKTKATREYLWACEIFAEGRTRMSRPLSTNSDRKLYDKSSSLFGARRRVVCASLSPRVARTRGLRARLRCGTNNT